MRVGACESGNRYNVVAVHGGVTYYGRWQANGEFWTAYGGDASYLGGSSFTAPAWMQNLVAYRGYLARGWQPWQCAGA